MIKQNERILHFLPRMTNSCYAGPEIMTANTIPVFLRATIKQVKDDAGKTCFPWNWDKGVVCVTMTLAWCSSLQWADYRRLPASNVTVRVTQPQPHSYGGQTFLPVLGQAETRLSLPPRPPPQPGVSLPDAGALLQLRGLSEECLLHVRYICQIFLPLINWPSPVYLRGCCDWSLWLMLMVWSVKCET